MQTPRLKIPLSQLLHTELNESYQLSSLASRSDETSLNFENRSCIAIGQKIDTACFYIIPVALDLKLNKFLLPFDNQPMNPTAECRDLLWGARG